MLSRENARADAKALTATLRQPRSRRKRCPLPDYEEWQLLPTQPGTPQQNNGSDCGVFVCLAVSFLAEGLPLEYGPPDIGRAREMIARDLLRGFTN